MPPVLLWGICYAVFRQSISFSWDKKGDLSHSLYRGHRKSWESRSSSSKSHYDPLSKHEEKGRRKESKANRERQKERPPSQGQGHKFHEIMTAPLKSLFVYGITWLWIVVFASLFLSGRERQCQKGAYPRPDVRIVKRIKKDWRRERDVGLRREFCLSPFSCGRYPTKEWARLKRKEGIGEEEGGNTFLNCFWPVTCCAAVPPFPRAKPWMDPIWHLMQRKREAKTTIQSHVIP